MISSLTVMILPLFNSCLCAQSPDSILSHINSELVDVKSNVESCTSGLTLFIDKQQEIKLNLIGSLENLVDEEIKSKKNLIENFDDCISSSKNRLDSLQSVLSSYSNLDSISSNTISNSGTQLNVEFENYNSQIDSIRSAIDQFSLEQTELLSALSEVEQNFAYEFERMKSKALAELKAAERKLNKLKKQAEKELINKTKIDLPKIKFP